ncbi:melatonin-related receptor [Nematostella vectensis]|uniref:melatonin-related receptor n=1 Tax=Nematostella vectensis TaxID=45351 RepID=UPI0020772C3A|nr:melatonin-related receptor [Nematostella vectensis]
MESSPGSLGNSMAPTGTPPAVNSSPLTTGFQTTVMVILTIAALTGNAVVGRKITHTPRLHRVTSLFTMTLVLADLLMALLVMPLTCWVNAAAKWDCGIFMCQVQGLAFHFLSSVSPLVLGITAAYLCLRHTRPENKIYRGVNTTAICLTLVWISVLMTSLLPIVTGAAQYGFSARRGICFLDVNNSLSRVAIGCFELIVFNFLPIVLIALGFTRSLRTLLRLSTIVIPTEHSIGSELTKEEIGFIRNFIGNSVALVVCWIPVVVVNIFDTFSSTLPRWVYLLHTYLWFIMSAARPMIYLLTMSSESARVPSVRVSDRSRRHRSLIDEAEL